MTPAEQFLQALQCFAPRAAGDPHWEGHIHDVFVDVHELEDDQIYIEEIQTTRPGRGQGTRALKALVGLADEYGVVLELFADPTIEAKTRKIFFEDPEYYADRLAAWYSRFGFEPIESDDYGRVWMQRLPQ
jgi:GNAT superfamily N-acetyltransferase